MNNFSNQLIIILFTILMLVLTELRFVFPFSYLYVHFFLLQFLWIYTHNWQRYLSIVLFAFLLDLISGQMIGLTLVLFSLWGLVLNFIHNYVPFLDSRLGILKRSIWTFLGIISIGIINNWGFFAIILTLIVTIILQTIIIIYFEKIISSTNINGEIGIE